MKTIKKLLFVLCLLTTVASAQHNGTPVGSPGFGVGKFYLGLTSLSDTNYYILPSESFTTATTFTVEQQLISTATTLQVSLGMGSNTTTQNFMGISASGHFIVDANGFSGILDSGITINDGVWHQCAMVVTPTLMSTFCDGVAGATLSGVYVPLTVTAGTLGSFEPAAGFAWTGGMDETVVWNYARYTGSYTAPTAAYSNDSSGLISIYHLDNNANDTTGVPSIIYSPQSVTVGTTGNVITLTGNGTTWTESSFSLSGGTGASITTSSVPSMTSATVTITAGSAAGTLTLSDGTSSVPITVTGAESFTASPNTLTVGTTENGVTLTGTGTSWNGDTTFTLSGGTGASIYSQTYNSATSFSLQINAGSATGTLTLSDGTASTPITVTAVSGTVIDPSNAAIHYSPGNWSVTSGLALSINSASYFDVMFTGTSVQLTFNISNEIAPLPQIEYQIDGYSTQSPWTTVVLASTVNIPLPSYTSGAPYHLLSFRTKATTAYENRWNAPSNSSINLTSIVLSTGGTVTHISSASPGDIWFFGDSITEGTLTVCFECTSYDTDWTDGTIGWAYQQRSLLGYDVGIIGLGAAGWSVGGAGNVPAMTSSYNHIMAGITRPADSNLKLIVINQGTNDIIQGATLSAVQAAATTTLNGMLSNYPGVPIAVMEPFDATYGPQLTTTLQTAIAATTNPGLIHWVPTTGFLNVTYGANPPSSPSGNIHPTGPNDLGFIGPQVAMVLRQILNITLLSHIYY